MKTASRSVPAQVNVRLLAFYLPQYHPIPENDEWWGKGFTEWTNVAKARPLFKGHDQPHLPADLGFYDLRLPEVREAQADLAKAHGIHGFCYYHYWFNGRRLLNRPFDEIRASGRPDFPFCLCWANESWTRRWDGFEQEILLGQDYNDEDLVAHARWLTGAFADPRYIRVDGRPLFLVYRAARLPDSRRACDIWRREVVRSGLPEPFLCRVESFGDEHSDPVAAGFDAAVEFQPDWTRLPRRIRTARRWAWLGRLLGENRAFDVNEVREYADLAAAARSKPNTPYLRFPCVAPGFDNTARHPSTGATVFHRPSPEVYASWLRHAVERVNPLSPSHRIVFINAWNEWGEGAHLEPCQTWGHTFLEATRSVLLAAR